MKHRYEERLQWLSPAAEPAIICRARMFYSKEGLVEVIARFLLILNLKNAIALVHFLHGRLSLRLPAAGRQSRAHVLHRDH